MTTAIRQRPQYLRDDECVGCLEVRPLLLPVRFTTCYSEPGTVEIIFLCLSCRLNWRDDGNAALVHYGSPFWHLVNVPDRRTVWNV